MTKLSVCSPQIGIRSDSVLGGEVYDREILAGLAQLGASVDIPLLGQLEHDRTIPWRVRPGPWRSSKTFYGVIPNILFFPKLVRSRTDVFRVFELRYSGWAALSARRLNRIPVVFHVNHLEPRQNMSPIDAWLARRCQAFTTLSEHTRQQVISHYQLRNMRSWVIAPGIDNRFQPQSVQRVTTRPTLLYLGAIIERKNLAVLIDAVNQLARSGWQVDLLLAGSGDPMYERALAERAVELGVSERVSFLGRVTEDEKIRLYNSCDIFVFPSLREGFGMAPAEAMACGAPVVVANSGALPEVVGETGLLADPLYPKSFATAIQSLLDDPTRRRQIGEAGRERVRTQFRWDRAAQQTLDAYSEVRAMQGS